MLLFYRDFFREEVHAGSSTAEHAKADAVVEQDAGRAVGQ